MGNKYNNQIVDDRLQVILNNEDFLNVYKKFGITVFSRTSIFDGLDKLLDEIQPEGVCVEIGTRFGLTSILLSGYFDKVYTIDIDPNTKKNQILAYLGINNVEIFNVRDNEEKAHILKDKKFNFAYIDGDHKNDTLSDFELVKHCGNVIFHEYGTSNEVTNFVNSMTPEKIVKTMAYVKT